MGMHYWHNAETQTVYSMHVEAASRYSNHKPPRYRGSDVYATLKWLSARWSPNALRGGWMNTGALQQNESFDARDSPSKAEEFFLMHHSPKDGATEIDAVMYATLEAKYKVAASASRPPPLP
jgi:hypothetical protein